MAQDVPIGLAGKTTYLASTVPGTPRHLRKLRADALEIATTQLLKLGPLHSSGGGDDLAKRRLVEAFPAIEPRSDHFRLLFRRDDPRRSLFLALAAEAGDKPIVWHCAAGKDRTGFAAAMILTALAASRDAIVADYLVSNELWKPHSSSSVSTLPQIARDALAKVEGAYLDAAWEALEAEHGSPEAFVAQALGGEAGMEAFLADEFGTVLLVGSKEFTIIGKPTVPYCRVRCTVEQEMCTPVHVARMPVSGCDTTSLSTRSLGTIVITASVPFAASRGVLAAVAPLATRAATAGREGGAVSMAIGSSAAPVSLLSAAPLRPAPSPLVEARMRRVDIRDEHVAANSSGLFDKSSFTLRSSSLHNSKVQPVRSGKRAERSKIGDFEVIEIDEADGNDDEAEADDDAEQHEPRGGGGGGDGDSKSERAAREPRRRELRAQPTIARCVAEAHGGVERDGREEKAEGCEWSDEDQRRLESLEKRSPPTPPTPRDTFAEGAPAEKLWPME